MREVASQAVDDADWAELGVGRAMQLLRSVHPGVVRRAVRRLHIRLWHALAARLCSLLSKTGVPQAAMMQAVADTCRVCHSWTMHGQRSISSGQVHGAFNEDLQLDLIFWHTHMVMHMIDSCIRWPHTEILPIKDAAGILECITMLWFRQYGSPQTITSDNEGGLDSEDGRNWVAR